MTRQRGAALLAAMLTVTLVATLAAGALWQQWRAVEIEAAERSRAQASWILTGALDWSRLILREDMRSSSTVDHLGEPWAVPLQEARLSTFLAADRQSTADSDADNVFLSGAISDLHGRLNVANLLQNSTISETHLRMFSRLFEALGLPQAQLQVLVDNLRLASDIAVDNPGASTSPLPPQRTEQLAWLGVAPATIATLQPYVTILPGPAVVNLNTAPAQVIYAVLPGIAMADAQRLVAARDRSPFRTRQDVVQLLPQSDLADAQFGFVSRYFEVVGRLRLGDDVIVERSVVVRDGENVRVVSRDRGPTAAMQAAPAASAAR